MSDPETAKRGPLHRAIDALDFSANLLSRLALVMLLVLILVQVVARYIFQSPVGGIVDISRQYLMPVIVLLSISYLEASDGHIRILILYERRGEMYRAVVNLVGNLATCAFFTLLLYASGRHAIDAFDRGVQTSGDIDFPLYTALIIAPAMSLLMVLRTAVKSYLGVVALRHGNSDYRAGTNDGYTGEPV